ncbi:MAG TPA: UDP-N-acetylenolpyruvoylglucosamine reductase [Planctomycetaceae bacterium]|nr:UDP-N-acetylenolpyruvoylglucosamine reductase [Planctomycetaceae bacterium]
MRSFRDFAEITQRDEMLDQHTWLKVGGPAQFLVRPRTRDELVQVVATCHEEQIPVHVLGSGSNLLVRDEGVSGVVLHLGSAELGHVTVDGNRVRAGAGALLSHTISESVKAGLGGLDALVGIPGTIGGALHGNAGGKSGDIGQFVKSVDVLTASGEQRTRRDEELSFSYRQSSLNELILLEAEFELAPESYDLITHRMRKLWIMKKATQPLVFQSAGCIFKNPRGMSAGLLIDQAGLKGTRIGHAEISDRHANFIVTHTGATARDVLRLIDLARSKVSEQFGVELELEVQIW